MGGRIRTIKPEILDNERTARLTHEAWRLFVSMIALADDYGSLAANPERLRAIVFWGQPTERRIVDLLGELADVGLIAMYSERGAHYAHLLGWSEHQRVDKRGRPRVPLFVEESTLVVDPRSLSRDRREDSRESRESLAPDLDLDLDLEGKKDQKLLKPVADKPRHEPLPFTVEVALGELASSSGGRFVLHKLTKGQAVHATTLIRQFPVLTSWTLVADWLRSGGESYRGNVDVRALRNFPAWHAHAEKWDTDGRRPIAKGAAKQTAIGWSKPPHSSAYPTETCSQKDLIRSLL